MNPLAIQKYPDSVREPIGRLSAECEIKETIMNPEESEAFLDKEQKNWKGHI